MSILSGLFVATGPRAGLVRGWCRSAWLYSKANVMVRWSLVSAPFPALDKVLYAEIGSSDRTGLDVSEVWFLKPRKLRGYRSECKFGTWVVQVRVAAFQS